VKEPYGVALILSAWNYPVRLLFFPVRLLAESALRGPS
jgi:acyl-CoA reductase-like NAD-dependent aldehyde dehydrogenase